MRLIENDIVLERAVWRAGSKQVLIDPTIKSLDKYSKFLKTDKFCEECDIDKSKIILQLCKYFSNTTLKYYSENKTDAEASQNDAKRKKLKDTEFERPYKDSCLEKG